MNQLESAVGPLLSLIVRGLPVSLLPPGEALAQWITLKAMVAEHSAPRVGLTPQVDREAFAQERTFPAYYRIYVALNLSQSRSLYYRTSQAIGFGADGPNPPLEGMAKNIHAMTMIIGRAVLHVTAARIADFQMEEKVLALGFHDRCRIWPSPLGTISFPARPNLDMKGIMLVATGLQRYFAVSKKTWTETPLA